MHMVVLDDIVGVFVVERVGDLVVVQGIRLERLDVCIVGIDGNGNVGHVVGRLGVGIGIGRVVARVERVGSIENVERVDIALGLVKVGSVADLVDVENVQHATGTVAVSASEDFGRVEQGEVTRGDGRSVRGGQGGEDGVSGGDLDLHRR